MTVKEEIQLHLSGVTSAEIKDLKEREKLENNPPAEEPPKEDPPKEDPPAENVSSETSEENERIKELETQLAKLQEENTHRDLSGEVDDRDDFAKGVDIFKNAF